MCNFKYIFINEIGFIKKNVIIVGKSTRSRVLRDRVRLHGAPKGPMEQKKILHHARQSKDEIR